MQLTKEQRRRWRREQNLDGRPFDPFFSCVQHYICYHCGSIHYYRGDTDVDAPQYITLRKITKLGYGIGASVCHDCWHEKGYKNSVVRHNSGCRICELAYWNRVAARRAKVTAKLAQEKAKANRAADRTAKQISGGGKQVWVRISPTMSKRRKHNKDMAHGRSRRRRVGTV